MQAWRPAIIARVGAPPLTPLAAAVLHVPPPERALVIECGNGDAALFLAREFPTARIRGIDSSAAQVQTATDRVGLDPEGRIAFKTGKPRKLPYPDDFFDLLVQLSGHPHPAETARVLRPGGHLVLTAPAPLSRAARHRKKLQAIRLARHSFNPIRSENAGNGSFQIMHLNPHDRGLSR